MSTDLIELKTNDYGTFVLYQGEVLKYVEINDVGNTFSTGSSSSTELRVCDVDSSFRMKLYYEERLCRDTTIIDDDDVNDNYTYDSAIEGKYGAFYQQHPLLEINPKFNIEIVTCTIYVYRDNGKPIYVGLTCRDLAIRDKEHATQTKTNFDGAYNGENFSLETLRTRDFYLRRDAFGRKNPQDMKKINNWMKTREGAYITWQD
eukprot:g13157.t1